MSTHQPLNKTAWVIVAGGFHQRGGMDKANYALASYLISTGQRVFLVSHDVDQALSASESVQVKLVARPWNSVFLGEFALDRAGRKVKRQLRSEGWRVCLIANGASCLRGDVNWAHYVHGAWKTYTKFASRAQRIRNLIQYRICCLREKRAFQFARLILTNSNLTTRHVEKCTGSHNRKIRTIYLGADALSPANKEQRAAAKLRMGLPADKPVALFAGALALDSRKGLDVLLQAWERLLAELSWDVTLLVAGDGPAKPALQERVQRAGLSGSVQFLGFRTDMGSVLAASDLLVSPVRYEPYGLNVQEALLCGISVLTTACAGVAERFPGPLRPLLLQDPEDVAECIEKLLLWRRDIPGWQLRFSHLGEELRARSWRDMAQEIVGAIETEWAPEERSGQALNLTGPLVTEADRR